MWLWRCKIWWYACLPAFLGVKPTKNRYIWYKTITHVVEKSSNNNKKSDYETVSAHKHAKRTCQDFHMAFPMMPEAPAAYDNRQKSWLGRPCPLHSFLSVCLHSSAISRPQSMWHLVCVYGTQKLTAESQSQDSVAGSRGQIKHGTVCTGPEWAERVTAGSVWRRYSQLILSLV